MNVDLTPCYKAWGHFGIFSWDIVISTGMARDSDSPLIQNPQPKSWKTTKKVSIPLAGLCLCVSVETLGNDHQSPKLSVPFFCDYRPGGVLWGSQEGRYSFVYQRCLSLPLSLSLWVHTIGGVPAGGGILLFQAECTLYSKHPLSCFTLGRADRHKSLCRCDGARREKGSEGHGFFFFLLQPTMMRGMRAKERNVWMALFRHRAAHSDIKFKG